MVTLSSLIHPTDVDEIEVDVDSAIDMLSVRGTFVDIRDEFEVQSGIPQNAVWIPRSYLEMKIVDYIETLDDVLILICASGVRSLYAAKFLRTLGLKNVFSISGGCIKWLEKGYLLTNRSLLSLDERQRYRRHLQMPEIGEKGQLLLKAAHVVIVGCGGLGNPSSLYLAAAGVGKITLIDGDVIDISNLQRQIIFRECDVGKLKSEVSAALLMQLNSNISVVSVPERICKENVHALIDQCDVIVDCTDNFSTRYLINDRAVELGVPLVHGSVYKFEGQITVFWPQRGEKHTPCYRCVYPEAPPAELAPACNEAGVLGVLPGVIGTWQALEAIKLITRVGNPSIGTLQVLDLLNSTVRNVTLEQNHACQCCDLLPQKRSGEK